MLTTALAFYLGAALSHSQVRSDDYQQQLQDAFTTLFAVGGGRIDMDRAAGGRIYGGMEVLPWLSLEADYTNVGTIANGYTFISIHGAILGGTEVVGNAKMDALGLSAVVHTPQWQGLSGHARAGIARTRLRGSQEGCRHPTLPNEPIVCSETSGDTSQTRPVFGFGVDYGITHCWTARLGWDRYFGVGKKFESLLTTSEIPGRGKFDVDFFALGAQYRF